MQREMFWLNCFFFLCFFGANGLPYFTCILVMQVKHPPEDVTSALRDEEVNLRRPKHKQETKKVKWFLNFQPFFCCFIIFVFLATTGFRTKLDKRKNIKTVSTCQDNSQVEVQISEAALKSSSNSTFASAHSQLRLIYHRAFNATIKRPPHKI